MRSALAWLVVGVATLGCATPPPVGVSAAQLLQLPASFAGELPCASCSGIRTELDLRANGIWYLRSTYLGRGDDAVHEAMGSFTLPSDSDRLVLRGTTEPRRAFRVVDPDTLRMLDLEGKEIGSTLPYELRREDPYRMRKIYSAQ